MRDGSIELPGPIIAQNRGDRVTIRSGGSEVETEFDVGLACWDDEV